MSYDFNSLLAKGGHMREFMRNAEGGGDWVDDICDALHTEATRLRLEVLADHYDAKAVNIGAIQPDGSRQISIRWEGTGWDCRTGTDVEDMIIEFIQRRKAVLERRNRK